MDLKRLSALEEVFREVFNNPDLTLNELTTSNDVEGWDSFSHINLIAAIEVYFNIEFSQSEALGFENVGELLEAINTKLKS